MNPGRTKLGNLIEQALRKKGLRQREAAKACGINPSHLSMFMRGKRGIAPKKCGKLAELLMIPAHEFIGQGSQVIIQNSGEPLTLEETATFVSLMLTEGMMADDYRFLIANDNARRLVSQLWLGLRVNSTAGK